MGVKLDGLENVLSEKSLSQADLARRSGLSAHTIGRAVRDKEPLSETSANKIAGALRVRVDNLQSKSVENADTDLRAQHKDPRHTDPRRIKEAMAIKGMNPTELAAKTGLSVATVSSAIRGARQPQKQTIEKIAGALGEGILRYDSESAQTFQTSVEIRAKAGQRSTVTYPEDSSNAGYSTCQKAPTVTGSQSVVQEPVAIPAAVNVAAVEQTAEHQKQGSGTLYELYSHVQQSRRIVAALLEHVGAIEEQIRQAVTAGTEGQNGRG